MTAFSSAVDAIFDDPNMADEATWVSPFGPVVVRVIRSRPDEVFEMYGQRGVASTIRMSARASEITPEEGQSLIIGDTEFAIFGAPRRDAMHLVWTFDAVEAKP